MSSTRIALVSLRMAAAITTIAFLAGCVAAPPSQRPTVPPAHEASTQPCLPDQVQPPGSRSLTATQAEIPLPVSLTLTEGWKGCGLFLREETRGVTILGFWSVVSVPEDPCHWAVTSPAPLGDSVEDLMQAVVDQQLTSTGLVTDVTIDGFKGKSVSLEVSGDFGSTPCSGDTASELRFWYAPGDSTWYVDASEWPFLRARVWAIDVHGTRVAIQAATTSRAAGVLDEAGRIVDSIDFEPAGS